MTLKIGPEFNSFWFLTASLLVSFGGLNDSFSITQHSRPPSSKPVVTSSVDPVSLSGTILVHFLGSFYSRQTNANGSVVSLQSDYNFAYSQTIWTNAAASSQRVLVSLNSSLSRLLELSSQPWNALSRHEAIQFEADTTVSVVSPVLSSQLAYFATRQT